MPKIPSLSRREVSALMNSSYNLMRLATSRKDSGPHVVPVWFIKHRNKLYVPCSVKSLKARNIINNPRVSAVIDTYNGGLLAKGILVSGTARILSGSLSRRINYRIHSKYLGRTKIKEKKWKRFMQEDDATIEIVPEKILTWNFSKLRF